MSRIRKRQPRPAIDLFHAKRDVLRERIINDVLSVVVTPKAVGDVRRESGVIVAVGIGGIWGQGDYDTKGRDSLL